MELEPEFEPEFEPEVVEAVAGKMPVTLSLRPPLLEAPSVTLSRMSAPWMLLSTSAGARAGARDLEGALL